MVYLEPDGAGCGLADWTAVRGAASGPLFLPVHKSGQIIAGRVTKPVSDYSVIALLEVGADIATVQHLASHASVVTTAHYDRRGEATKQKASAFAKQLRSLLTGEIGR